MSRDDHELIAQYVNANSPGAARFVEVPDMGHTLQSYTNWADAFAGKSSGLNQNGAKLIIDWLKDRERAGNQSRGDHDTGEVTTDYS
jgi:hypothetical protein